MVFTAELYCYYSVHVVRNVLWQIERADTKDSHWWKAPKYQTATSNKNTCLPTSKDMNQLLNLYNLVEAIIVCSMDSWGSIETLYSQQGLWSHQRTCWSCHKNRFSSEVAEIILKYTKEKQNIHLWKIENHIYSIYDTFLLCLFGTVYSQHLSCWIFLWSLS